MSIVPGPEITAKDQLEPRKVLALQEWAPGAFHIEFEYPYSFRPGEVVALAEGPLAPLRYYSLASAPGKDRGSVLFDLMPDGYLTPRLAQLREGDILWVGKPFGSFQSLEDQEVWIAAGTGIAPFLSMSLSGLGRNATLVQGSRSLQRLYGHAYWRDLLGENYRPCISREPVAQTYFGRLTEYIQEKGSDMGPERRYLICGSTHLVVSVRDILLERGIPFDRISTEIYF